MERDRLTDEEGETLRAQLREFDIPVNATARLLNVSEGSMQRFLSGKYAMPRRLAKVLEAVLEFRRAAAERT